MAGTSVLPFTSRFLLALSVLLLFIPPIFSVFMFFWPLIVSTVLGVLAVVSFGQQGGISTEQKEETPDNADTRPDLVISSAANTEKISDVLMVGNREVTWLEWLHNEDMEKCRARERVDCMPARWDLDQLDVASEASVGSLASSLEENSTVDAYASAVMNESFAKELVENTPDMVSVDAFGCANEERDEIRMKAPSLKVGDMKIESPFTDEVTVFADCACSDWSDTSRTCRRKTVNLDINDTHIENTEERSRRDLTAVNGRDSGFADGGGLLTSSTGQVLTVQGKSIMRAISSEVRDVTASSQCGSQVVVENMAIECVLPSLTMSAIDASEVSFPNVGISHMLETDASVRHGIGQHRYKGGANERDLSEDNEGPTHKQGAEERCSSENNKGAIWDASEDKENTSSLRFSFFDNGCPTLQQCMMPKVALYM